MASRVFSVRVPSTSMRRWIFQSCGGGAEEVRRRERTEAWPEEEESEWAESEEKIRRMGEPSRGRDSIREELRRET